jgi:ABC-2 type transport system permease protein
MRVITALAKEMGAAVRASYANRTSFLIELIGMAINDGFILLMWFMFFAGFRSVGGWRFADLALLIGIVAMTVGTTGVFTGGYRNMAFFVLRGDVDVLLTQPKPVLPRLLVSESTASAWGDVLFGSVLISGVARLKAHDLPELALALIVSLTIYLSTGVLFASLVFWTRGARSFSRELLDILILFATYPGSIWSGPMKLLVYTIFPAEFMVLMPVAFLRAPTLIDATIMIAAVGTYGGLALVVFNAGLRRYRRGAVVDALIRSFR